MREACAQLAQWRARFEASDLSISVNTSANEFADPEFMAELKAVLAEHDLPPHALELEITESIFLHPDPSIAKIIEDIRGFGIRVGLDDFGTGFSSLAHLRSLPFDVIKIDRCFVSTLTKDAESSAIIRAVMFRRMPFGGSWVEDGA